MRQRAAGRPAVACKPLPRISKSPKGIPRRRLELGDLLGGQRRAMPPDHRAIERLDRLPLPRHGLLRFKLFAGVPVVVLEHLIAERLADEVADRAQGSRRIRDEILEANRVQRGSRVAAERRSWGKDGSLPLAGDLVDRLREIGGYSEVNRAAATSR
jgi:hypothetical protein